MSHTYAGFWRRSGASFIDGFIFIIALIAINLALFGEDYLNWLIREPESYYDMYSTSSELIGHIVPLLFTLYFWRRYMGTPGKLLLNCHVVDADTLKPMSIKQSIVRYFAYILSFLPLCLGFFWIIWDKRKQGFHDKLANTLVVIVDDANKTLEELEQEAL